MNTDRHFLKNTLSGNKFPEVSFLNLHVLIKAGMTLFLILYLSSLYLSDSAKNVPMDEITQEMEADTTVTLLKKRGRTDLKRYYQLDEQDINGYLFYKDISPMSVDELFIVQTNSSTQAEACLESAQAHLESQKKVFEGYGTDQMALLGNAVVEKKGNYVYYFCGADADQWKQAFLDLI